MQLIGSALQSDHAAGELKKKRKHRGESGDEDGDLEEVD